MLGLQQQAFHDCAIMLTTTLAHFHIDIEPIPIISAADIAIAGINTQEEQPDDTSKNIPHQNGV